MSDLPDFDGRTKLTRGTMNALVEEARRARYPPNGSGVNVTDFGSGGRHYDVPLPPDPLGPSVRVLVRNDTGGDVKQGYILGLGDMLDGDATTDTTEVLLTEDDVVPAEEPADDQPATSMTPTFKGILPMEDRPFVVLLDALADKQTGRGIVQGVAVCKVSMIDPDHAFAVPLDREITQMLSSEIGNIPILWLSTEEGSSHTAVILLPGGLVPEVPPDTCVASDCVQFIQDVTLEGLSLYKEVKMLSPSAAGLQVCDECP
jgi:hypothetical protein